MLNINPLKDSAEANNSASFDQPLELLLSCHKKIQHYSSALYKIVTTVQQEGWLENYINSVDQVRHYFNVAVPEHHLDEEVHLFPTIIALDPEFKKPDSLEIVTLINNMIKEHVESDALWEKLDSMLAERSQDFSNLEQLARQFEADMHEHARIENEMIFPYAEKYISKSDFKKMGQEIARRRGIKQLTP